MNFATKYPDLFTDLAEPWPDNEVRKLTKGGKSFGYLRAGQVMSRLDDVVGPENWWARFQRDRFGGETVLCKLTIRLPDGSRLTKEDFGAPQGMPDEGDDEKSAASDSLKRAAVHFGIGRWLRDPMPNFVLVTLNRPRATGDEPAPENPKPVVGQNGPGAPPPTGPKPVVGQPAEAASARRPADPGSKENRGKWASNGGRAQEPANRSGKGDGKPPRTGKALFAWLKGLEEKHDVGLIKYVAGWAKLQDYQGRMVDWDAGMVAQAYAEASRKLQSLAAGQPSTEYEEALAN